MYEYQDEISMISSPESEQGLISFLYLYFFMSKAILQIILKIRLRIAQVHILGYKTKE